MEIIGIILSILALSLSIFTYFKHDKKIKQQSRLLNEYNLEKIVKEKEEEKKAKIEAFVVKENKGTRTVKIYNKGKSLAKNVNVKIPEHDGYHVFTNPCPIDIRPQNSIEIKLGALIENHPDKIKIDFEWSDEYKEENRESQMIQI
ncbi:MAG: hypothetical protein JXL97_04435 [Bacteroidales bacterium]|nr:hypothetical protein [Bacteroidales bacterium]